MATLPDYPETELRTLTLLFLLKFDERITELEESDERWDEDAWRRALAEESPLMARRLEQMTQEDRKSALKLVATAEAVAYVVRHAADDAFPSLIP